MAHGSQQPSGPSAIAADDFTDVDSAVQLSHATSQTSLRSSVLAYRQENGRTYHGLSDGKYFLPNDDAELERLDTQHTLFLLTLDDKLCLCPKNEGAKRVLDVGTGTGVWAIDYADNHPEAEVIGVDLSPVQPSFVPPNCMFEIDDIEKDWTWSQPFDFIFSRTLAGSLSDTQAYFQKAFDNLEPGGYFELQDVALPVTSDDGTVPEDSFLVRMSHMTVEAAAKLGRRIDLVRSYPEMLAEAGFVDISTHQFKWPSNMWPRDSKYKELGCWTFANINRGLEGMTLAHFTRGLGLSKEETLVYCVGARRELRDVSMHAYWPILVCYGKKPDA